MNKELIKKIFLILTISLSIIIPDIGVRYLISEEINFVNYNYLPPLLFTISYIIIILLIYFSKPKIGKKIYLIFIIIFNLYAIAQLLHFRILDRCLTITDILVANQATGMVGYTFSQLKISYILVVISSLILSIFSFFLMKKVTYKISKRKYFIPLIIVLFILTRGLAISFLGNKVSNKDWNFWNVSKNVYIDYNNPSRSFIISGSYEYFFRDIYTYIRDLTKKENNNDIEEINKYISKLNYQKEDNEYTNIFKDKNLIMIMLESIDSWLVNEEVMPTLTNLKNTGLDFTNRYSPTFGGGSTINTEFASLTSLYAAIVNQPIFQINNNYDYSLPNLFKSNGYKVNSVHMNEGWFYNRSNFHLNLGFENHYALGDLIKDVNFEFDTNLVKNNASYNYIINKNNKFFTFITTYSAHVPYLNNNLCKNLNTKLFEVKNDEETTCLKTLANETDNFIKLLIENLKEDNLLKDTVLVLYSDHYAYGYSDTSKWTNIKDSKLSQNTTFVIWNNELEHKKIDIINDTLDIPVTLFNMFGIDYNPNIYLGTDIFSKYHEEFIYFNDYTWKSKNLYFTGQNVSDKNYVREISEKVNDKIKINEKIIASNFYKSYN